MAKNSVSAGVLLIGAAIVLFLGKLGVLSFLGSLLWPLLILAAGLLLHYFYFRGNLSSALLIPGAMLVVYALMFLFCTIFGWGAMKVLWPGFLFGIAAGLYEVQWFDRRSSTNGFARAALLLAAASALLFILTLLLHTGIYLIVLVLVAIGLFLVMRKSRTW